MFNVTVVGALAAMMIEEDAAKSLVISPVFKYLSFLQINQCLSYNFRRQKFYLASLLDCSRDGKVLSEEKSST